MLDKGGGGLVLTETRNALSVAPSAARLTNSLRDIGYSFETAIADLVDNSLSAGATKVAIEILFEPRDSHVLIWDNGKGMSQAELVEALRFGSRRDYDDVDLGRFGLGLKTGSLSQCRRLSVLSRSINCSEAAVATLDLEFIGRTDEWAILADEETAAIIAARGLLGREAGTVVIWEDLDRVLPDRFAESGWGRRRLATLAKKTSEHLSLVFHRFLEGTHGLDKIEISVNGQVLLPWDPYALSERHTQELATEIFEVETESGSTEVRFKGHILPARDAFSTPEAFERMSGPLKWNRQQGLYIYRNNRLVQFGGWNGIRAIDEHTKLARASIDFESALDEDFQINVAKMSVVLPPTLRGMLERPINDLCVRADAAYRRSSTIKNGRIEAGKGKVADGVSLIEVGIALKAALLESSDLSTYKEALILMQERNPELARDLGLEIRS